MEVTSAVVALLVPGFHSAVVCGGAGGAGGGVLPARGGGGLRAWGAVVLLLLCTVEVVVVVVEEVVVVVVGAVVVVPSLAGVVAGVSKTDGGVTTVGLWVVSTVGLLWVQPGDGGCRGDEGAATEEGSAGGVEALGAAAVADCWVGIPWVGVTSLSLRVLLLLLLLLGWGGSVGWGGREGDREGTWVGMAVEAIGLRVPSSSLVVTCDLSINRLIRSKDI